MLDFGGFSNLILYRISLRNIMTLKKKLQSSLEKYKTHLSVLLTNMIMSYESHERKTFLQMAHIVHDKPST